MKIGSQHLLDTANVNAVSATKSNCQEPMCLIARRRADQGNCTSIPSVQQQLVYLAQLSVVPEAGICLDHHCICIMHLPRASAVDHSSLFIAPLFSSEHIEIIYYFRPVSVFQSLLLPAFN